MTELHNIKGVVKGGEVVKDENLLWPAIWETISISLKSTGLLIWFFVLLLSLLEIKQYYNIDVIPNYNSSVDNAYGAVKGTISELF